MSLPGRQERFLDDIAAGDTAEGDTAEQVGFSYIIGIFQDGSGRDPSPEEAADYWGLIGQPSFPVLSDPPVNLIEFTPYEGRTLPGKCLLSPEMEMLRCIQGHGEDDWAFDIIREREGL